MKYINLIRLLYYYFIHMGKKKEFKLRIIRRRIIDWELYVVQVHRKFLWWEWRTDVKSYEYKDEAEECIECLQVFRTPEVVKEYDIKI